MESIVYMLSRSFLAIAVISLIIHAAPYNAQVLSPHPAWVPDNMMFCIHKDEAQYGKSMFPYGKGNHFFPTGPVLVWDLNMGKAFPLTEILIHHLSEAITAAEWTFILRLS